MKAALAQTDLAHGLGLVARVVRPSSTLPVLVNVLLKAEPGALHLVATNLEQTIACRLPAEVAQPGAITVPARTLVDLVATLKGEQVRLSLKDDTLQLLAGKSRTSLKGIPASEFPALPPVDWAQGITLDAGGLKDMIRQVVFAASEDEYRPVLTTVLVRLEGNRITLVAADGFRLSERRGDLPAGVPRPVSLLVPGRAMDDVGRMCAAGEVTLAWTGAQAAFRCGAVELITQLVPGVFPDYEQIIPKTCTTRLVASAAALAAACRQAEIFARQGSKALVLEVTPANGAPGKLKVSAEASETGQLETTLEAAVDGPGLRIAFNARFLKESLEALTAASLTLEATTPASPALFRPAGEAGLLHVLMPVCLAGSAQTPPPD